MTQEMVKNVVDKTSAGITLTAEQMVQFKKFQDTQVKAAKYTVKQAMMIARAKAAGLEPTEKEVDAEYERRQNKVKK